MKNPIFFGLTIFFFTVSAMQVYATGDAAKGKARYAVCQACHGADGMGNKALNSPKIAGQEPWYLERQLKNFKAGIRGADPKDTYGMQMRPMALTLADDQSIRDMAAYVSSMPVERTVVPTIKGDSEAGKAAYVICQACHGSAGEGNKTLNSPRLAGLQDWYVANDEAINNVAAYIATFK